MSTMIPAKAYEKALVSPIQSLLVVFGLWKTIVLVAALCSPGPGYDSSGVLYQPDVADSGVLEKIAAHVGSRLSSWDAIYFTEIAKNGYYHEQFYMAGYGWTSLISYFSSDLRATPALANAPYVETIVGSTLAHLFHLLSVLTISKLTSTIFPGPSGQRLAFLAALLHIISPAGIFLSAPYSESAFSLFSFLGLLFYAKAVPWYKTSSAMHDFSLLLAGLAFGVACTVRSNGLLYGVLFAEEAGRLIWSMKPSKTSGGAAGAAGEPVGLTANVTYTTLRRLTYTLLGGLSVAVGFAYPQYIAYQQFCTSTGARPWCSKTLPSVYSFLQSHYWGTGLFRYWTLSNIPLFLLAAPMLVLLFTSSIWAFQLNARLTTSPTHNVDHYQTTDKERQLAARTIRLLKSIAVPQTLLAVTALTSFHVQIVNRIASGYPVWYIFVAWGVVEQMKKSGGKAKTVMGNRKVGKKEAKMRETWKSWLAANWPMVTVRGMAMYALVQTVLFASFLPPA